MNEFSEIYDKKIDWKFISFLKDKFLFLQDIYPDLLIEVDAQVLKIDETDIFKGITIYKDCISNYINMFYDYVDFADDYDIVYRIMIRKEKSKTTYSWKEVCESYYKSIIGRVKVLGTHGPNDILFIKKLK